MANSFNKEERVAFEAILEGFQDALVMSKNVAVFNTDQTMMERAGDTIWRPVPYIAPVLSTGAPGNDISADFVDFVQLAVPSSINQSRTVPWTMNALELRDALQEGRLGDAAKQKLASEINVSILTEARDRGTLVVKRTVAASGFDDVAQCDAIMNETGVPAWDRYLALSTRDYNGMASNIATGAGTGARSFNGNKSANAYERAYVGQVAGFETFKMDYAPSLAKINTGLSVIVQAAAAASARRYVPASTSGGANVDNRTMTLPVTISGATLKNGDCFTIQGVNAVHPITKADTGQLKTFRVIDAGAGTGSINITISPPIIVGTVAGGGGGSDAEAEYANVSAAPATSAPFTFLNTAPATGAAPVNVFWQKDALEILPGRLAVPSDAGAAVLRASTDQGLELVMTKQFDVNTMKTKYRLDTRYGVVCKQPEMCGIMLFSQT